MEQVYPNFFIVGAAKCGTTSLYHRLSGHPDIYMCPIKEPHFFSKDIQFEHFDKAFQEHNYLDIEKYLSYPVLIKKHIAYIDTLDHYLELFRDVTNEKAIGECSTGYLYSELAAKEIFRTLPDARIIIILRDPVERAFSHYLMDQRRKNSTVDFTEAVLKDYTKETKGWGRSSLYIELGLYYEQVKRYLDVFPEDQVLIIKYEELKSDFKNVEHSICKFLDIPICELEENYRKYNVASVPRSQFLHAFLRKSRIRKKFDTVLLDRIKPIARAILYSKSKNLPPLTRSDRETLLPIFIEDIRSLAGLINLDLNNWMKHG